MTKQLPLTAEAEFDLLYVQHARALTRQAYLLCGHRRVAVAAVAHAFRRAWERWPQVTVDPDPAGWVRAVAYEYALSPWHRFHPRRGAPEAHPGPPADRALLDALLSLPRSYRRTLLLHDGLGLSVAETAAETESSTVATVNRVVHAHEALAGRLPVLREVPAEKLSELIRERLLELAAAQPVRTPPVALARPVSEHTTRRWIRAGLALTAMITAAAAFTLVTADRGSDSPADRQAPVSSPGPGMRGNVDGEGEGRGEIFAPQLRSSNERGHLDEDEK